MSVKHYVTILAIAMCGTSADAQTIPLRPLKTPQILSQIERAKSDSVVTVFNFWATWCGPCVAELPFFSEADSLLKDQKVRFVYISFDMRDQGERAARLLDSKGIKGRRILVDETDHDLLINGVDREWQGNIPYTLVAGKGKTFKHSHVFQSTTELIQFIKNIP